MYNWLLSGFLFFFTMVYFPIVRVMWMVIQFLSFIEGWIIIGLCRKKKKDLTMILLGVMNVIIAKVWSTNFGLGIGGPVWLLGGLWVYVISVLWTPVRWESVNQPIMATDPGFLMIRGLIEGSLHFKRHRLMIKRKAVRCTVYKFFIRSNFGYLCCKLIIFKFICLIFKNLNLS